MKLPGTLKRDYHPLPGEKHPNRPTAALSLGPTPASSTSQSQADKLQQREPSILVPRGEVEAPN